MIGYKKVYELVRGKKVERVLKIKTLTPIVHPQCGRGKLRCEKVKVLEAYQVIKSVKADDYYGTKTYSYKIGKKLKRTGPYRPVSDYASPSFRYWVGKEARSDQPVNADTWENCGSGINFFRSIKKAVNYQF